MKNSYAEVKKSVMEMLEDRKNMIYNGSKVKYFIKSKCDGKKLKRKIVLKFNNDFNIITIKLFTKIKNESEYGVPYTISIEFKSDKIVTVSGDVEYSFKYKDADGIDIAIKRIFTEAWFAPGVFNKSNGLFEEE